MSNGEIPLQHDLFSGEAADNRTQRQKRLDKARELPRQTEMFATREIAQFGVKAHPSLPLQNSIPLRLEILDVRTDEAKERDLMREAQERTIQLFPPLELPQPQLSEPPPLLLTAGTTLLLAAHSVVAPEPAVDEDFVLWFSGQALQLPFSLF